MAVHHRFLTRLVLDPNYSNSIIFELDRVMLGINFHGIVCVWLRHSCGCHICPPSNYGIGVSLVLADLEIQRSTWAGAHGYNCTMNPAQIKPSITADVLDQIDIRVGTI